MHRYLVERTFHSETRSSLPGSNDPTRAQPAFAENNARDGVIWVHFYVSPDHRKSFCIYDAPGPEAIRHASIRNGLPLDRITEVLVITLQSRLQPADEFANTIQNEESVC